MSTPRKKIVSLYDYTLWILGKLLGLMGKIVKGCVREVSLAQVSCILMYVYVAPPTPVGAWSMALGLRQCFEYYYYTLWMHTGLMVEEIQRNRWCCTETSERG